MYPKMIFLVFEDVDVKNGKNGVLTTKGTTLREYASIGVSNVKICRTA